MCLPHSASYIFFFQNNKKENQKMNKIFNSTSMFAFYISLFLILDVNKNNVRARSILVDSLDNDLTLPEYELLLKMMMANNLYENRNNDNNNDNDWYEQQLNRQTRGGIKEEESRPIRPLRFG